MNIFPLLKTSFSAMMANKTRTGLTVLGMVIGISAVIIVFSAGEGIRGLVLGQVESFGTDIIQTEIKIPSSKKGSEAEQQNASGLAQGVQITTLNIDDLEDVKKIPNVEDGYGAIMGQEQVSFGSENKKSFLFGVSPSYIDIDKSEIDYGRFFTDAEDKSLSRVAVLGSKIKKDLFGDSDAVGEFIKLHKNKYRVVGVMKEKGAVMTLEFDDFVYIPLRTMQKRILGVDHFTYMVHKINDLSLADLTAERIKSVLRENHNISEVGKEDFRVTTMEEMMDMLDTITGALTLLLLAIVAISLVVGGVGIMNIMYVIVSERTSEIGLRKAVGADYYAIMKQFLVESVLITLIGGLVGIVLGVIVSFFISLLAESYGFDWSFKVPLKAFVTAIVFSAVAGLGFGVYPAKKAAKMDPILALRKE